MEICTIVYQGWEMECCGDLFEVGDIVEWTVNKLDGGFLSSPISGLDDFADYITAFHPPEHAKYKIKVRIIKIQAIYYKYEKQKTMLNGKQVEAFMPVSGSGTVVSISKTFEAKNSCTIDLELPSDYYVTAKIINIVT